jgi:hypothetical protein
VFPSILQKKSASVAEGRSLFLICSTAPARTESLVSKTGDPNFWTAGKSFSAHST